MVDVRLVAPRVAQGASRCRSGDWIIIRVRPRGDERDRSGSRVRSHPLMELNDGRKMTWIWLRHPVSWP